MNVDLADAANAAAEKGLALVEDRSSEATNGKTSLEIVNHIVRIWLQSQRRDLAVVALRWLEARQLQDGSWSEKQTSLQSSVRATAFSVQMLYRGAKAGLCDGHAALDSGLTYLLERQEMDGTWNDRRWGRMDATSMTLGTLIMLFRDSRYAQKLRVPLRRASDVAWSLRTARGTWQKSEADCVETTAHYLQKFLAAGNGDNFASVTVKWLLTEQRLDGTWNNGDVDATCDATRALLLASARLSQVDGDVISDAINRAVYWLTSHFTKDGIGATVSAQPNLLHTADAIDTFLKYVHRIRQPALLLSAY
jgi:squalene cyclase